MAKGKLFCHIMNNLKQEVALVKTRLYAQEFQWKKRMWAIPNDALAYTDKKGNNHMMFDVNESDGAIRFLLPYKQNIIDNKCIKCGGKISIDAKNTWDLLKRKTINAIWGIDSSHIVLLIIMGIVCVGAVAGIMYLLGQNTKIQEQYTKLLEKTGGGTLPVPPLAPKFMLEVLSWQ